MTAQSAQELDDASAAVFEALEDTPNTTEMTTDAAPAQPIVQVVVDRSTALQQGLTEVQVLGIVANSLSPRSVGTITLDDEELSIYIEGADAPATVAELQDMLIPTMAGLVPLDSIATVEQVTVASQIRRDDGEQVVTVSLTPAEGELGAVTASVQASLDALDLPDGASAEIGGLADTQTESFK